MKIGCEWVNGLVGECVRQKSERDYKTLSVK